MSPENLPNNLPTGAVFLPINVTRGRRGGDAVTVPPLVLIDANRLEELQAFNWQTASGPRDSQPYRIEYNGPEGNKRLCRSVQLSRVVTGTDGRKDIFIDFRNGDRLDCRLGNLRALTAAEAAKTPAPALVKVGSTFAHWPAYAEAVAARRAELDNLALRFAKGGKAPRIPTADIGAMLSDILTTPEHFQGRPFSFFVDHLIGYVGPDVAARFEKLSGKPFITPVQVRLILLGERQRMPGIDYKKIAEVLPFRPRRPRAIVSQ